MKVLSIGTDRNLFKEDSKVSKRAILYGNKMEKLFIIVFSKKIFSFEKKNLSEKVLVFPTNSISKFFFIMDAFIKGFKILKREGISGFVITCQDPFFSGLVGLFLSKYFKIPLHIQIHTDFLSPEFYSNSLLDKAGVILAKFVIPRADFIRVVSERIRNNIINLNIKFKKMEVLPISFDSKSFLDGAKKDILSSYNFKTKIIMVSRLEKEKRIEDALFAMQNIIKKYPETGLFIVGSGSLLNYLKKIQSKLSLNNNVVFLGFRDDVASLLLSSDIFLLTSRYEGYGLSLIEAGFCNCPVITTDVGISGEIIKDGFNGLVYKVFDISMLSSKIELLIEDLDLRNKISLNLKKDLENKIISEDEYVIQYVKQLESLL